MKQRKEIKKRSKTSLKNHYAIFLAACLIAAFLGSEFSSSLNISSADDQLVQSIETEEDFQTRVSGITWTDVLEIIAENGTAAGREVTKQTEEEEIRESEDGNPMFERSRGVLANVVNQLSSGSIVVTLVAAIASITGSENMGVLILIILGAAINFGFWFFVINTFSVAMRRVFMEGMIYEKVTLQRFLFLIRVKRWFKASRTMLLEYIFYTLWCLTVIGGIVKRYSYFLVPYIVAENPDIKARQAITLSRKMMKGHKWECFKLELSFAGWWLLGAVTMGIFNVLFTNPYKIAAFTGYYAQLRVQAKENHIEGAELLNDRYLYEKADEMLIASKYGEVISVMESPEDEKEALTGWRGFLANNFGVIVMRRQPDRMYERHQAEYVRIHELIDDVQGLAYPTRLYPMPEEERRKLVQSINYMRHYTVWSLMAIFLAMSFVGWLWEVSLHLITDGDFVNRGALHGPWLPIYGTGSVLILTVLNRLRQKPILEFTAIVVLCGFLEYMTSLIMEIVTDGMRWWDYSGYFLNLNGRICAEGLLVFGIGGLAIVYFIAPVIDDILRRLNEKKVMTVCATLMLIFAADAVYSQFYPNTGEGITNIEKNDSAETAQKGITGRSDESASI